MVNHSVSINQPYLTIHEDPTFLAGHAANIFVKLNGQVTQIGVFGILHPSVLKNFELS
jgi:phenylalanyl-tRNA synthetase beta chain